jgi:hypothetical protein
MIRKTTGACLALLAVAAMAAWAAAPAQAELEFQSWETVQYGEGAEESEDRLVPATLSASQVSGEQAIFSLGTQVKCNVTETSSLATGSSPTLDFLPSYKECVLAGFFPVEINVGSCVLRAHLFSETEAGVFTGPTDVVCPGGGQIVGKVKSGSKTPCSFSIPPQTGKFGIKATDMNEDTPDDFTLRSEVEGITVVVEKGEGFCFFASPGTYTTGKYTANMLVTAKGTGGETPPVPVQPKDPPKKFHFQLEKAEDVEVIGGAQGAQDFKFDIGKVSCGNVLSREESNGFTVFSTFDLESTAYEECKHVGAPVEKAEVLFNSCVLRIRAGIEEPKTGQRLSGVNVACGPGGKMEVRVDNCTLTIPSQSGLNGEGIKRAVVVNVGAGKTAEIRVSFVLDGIAYEEGEGTACLLPNVVKKNGSLTGTVLFRALEEEGKKAQVGFWSQITP